jgi:hypothetical protein
MGDRLWRRRGGVRQEGDLVEEESVGMRRDWDAVGSLEVDLGLASHVWPRRVGLILRYPV